MVPSIAWALTLVLLATTALAQPAPARARRERGVTLTGNPTELRAALGVASVLFFDAEIRPEGITVDRERVRLVGTGERFVILELRGALRENERVTLEVPYADGARPERAVFSVVEHPSEVDTRLEVVRPLAAGSSCEAQLAQARAQAAALTPVRMVRSGLLGEGGVRVGKLEVCTLSTRAHGLKCMSGTLWVASSWVLLDFELHNASDHAPWRLRSAAMRNRESGAPWSVRAVEAEPSELAPGQTGRVLVEAAAPRGPEESFTLELQGSGGRTFTLSPVTLSIPSEESAP